jgi:hypothetical protein
MASPKGKVQWVEFDEPIFFVISGAAPQATVEGVVSGDFTVNVMRIVEARRSAASGKPVNLPLK